MIDLGNGYVIAVDDYNYTFGKMMRNKCKSSGEKFKPLAYCSSLAKAAEYARKYFVRQALKGESFNTA